VSSWGAVLPAAAVQGLKNRLHSKNRFSLILLKINKTGWFLVHFF
jgi:hypothetical protein